MTKEKSLTVNQKIAHASVILIIASLLGHSLSLFKEIIIAKKFGISIAMDAYYAAITFPSLVNNVLISTFGAVFISVYIKYKVKDNEMANRIASILINCLNILFTLAVLFIFILSPWIIKIGFHGFNTETINLSIKILRIVCFSIILSGLIGIVTGILHAKEEFTWPAFSQMIITITIIAFILLALEKLGIFVLAWGLIVGLIIQLLILVPVSKKRGFHYYFDFNWSHPAVMEIIKLGGLYLVGMILVECNILVDRIMASYLTEGSIAALGYAGKLINVPLVVFSSSLATAAFPFFTYQIVEGKISDMRDSLSKSIRMAGYIFIPLTVMLMVLGRPMIQLLYERGSFTPEATYLTSIIFVCYAIQLFFYSAGIIFVKVFLGLQDIVSLVKISIFSLIFNVILNAVFIKIIDPPAAGIALSTSVVYLSTSFILFILLKRRMVFLHGIYILKGLFKISICSGILGLNTLLILRLCKKIFLGSSIFSQIINLGLTTIFAIVIFAILSMIFRIEEFYKIKELIFNKIILILFNR